MIRLLESGERASRKAQSENQIRTVLFELSGAAINGLAVTPESLHTLLKVSAFERRGEGGTEADLTSRFSPPMPSLDLPLVRKCHLNKFVCYQTLPLVVCSYCSKAIRHSNLI